ncbi:MAG: hypothetical protein ACYCQJ_00220 [Nitrososphaerales archaeon]
MQRAADQESLEGSKAQKENELKKAPRIELDLKLAFLRYKLHKIEAEKSSKNKTAKIKEIKSRIRSINEELARREEEELAKKSRRRNLGRGRNVLLFVSSVVSPLVTKI